MSDAAGAASGEWLQGYAARASDLWGRSARAGAEIASRMGRRSLDDGDWTVDSVTADLIEASEMLTPLVGEGIELWLELVQRSMVSGPGRRG